MGRALAGPARACHGGGGFRNRRLCCSLHLPGQCVLYLQSFGTEEEDGRDKCAPLGGRSQAETCRIRRSSSRLHHEQTGCNACRAASLAHGGAQPQGQHRLSLGEATASRAHAQKKSLRAAEQDRSDIFEAREEWRASQPGLNPERLVFIDETWAKTNMVRLIGRPPRGQRLIATVPHGHWMTTTFVAALRHDAITAPCVFNAAMDGASFLTYVEHFLAPALRQGDVVVMDNLASHKVAGVREAIERAGAAVCYLPACSPDLNPIEQVFAKLKRLFARLPHAASTLSLRPSLTPWMSSRHENAPTILQIRAIATNPENALAATLFRPFHRNRGFLGYGGFQLVQGKPKLLCAFTNMPLLSQSSFWVRYWSGWSNSYATARVWII